MSKNGHIMPQYYKATVFETGTKTHTQNTEKEYRDEK